MAIRRYERATPEGTRDLLFEECAARREVESTLSRLFKARGYNRVITPTLEFFDVFDRESAGMPLETLYNVTDARGRLMVLRPDNTLPIARIAATRLRDETIPLRLFYSQNVFRRNPGLTGRRDESAQSGIELIGASGLRADLEILTTAVDALGQCGAPDFRIEIGHAGFSGALFQALEADETLREEIAELIEMKNYAALNDALDQAGDTQVARAIRRLPRLFGGEEVLDEAAALYDDQRALEPLSYLRNIYRLLMQLGLQNKVNIDLGLVHRGNYYTGVVFRGYIEGLGVTVLSGGRYDGLLGEFGSPMPATGFGVEVDALACAMCARGDAAAPKAVDVLVFGVDGCEVRALSYARSLNEQGLVCENCVLDSAEAARDYAARKGIGRLDVVKAESVEIITVNGTEGGVAQ